MTFPMTWAAGKSRPYVPRNYEPRDGWGPAPKYVAPVEMCQAYLNGMSLRALAAKNGLKYGKVRRGLVNAGVEIRTQYERS